MEYGVLCGLEHQSAEAGQRAGENLAGEQVGLSRQLRELHRVLGGVEDHGESAAVLFPGDADQRQVIPGWAAAKRFIFETWTASSLRASMRF